LHDDHDAADDIEDTSSTKPWNDTPLSAEVGVLDTIYVEGNANTKTRICKFLAVFRNRFSKQLRAKPANVPPMGLNVDVEKWDSNSANHQPPRRHSNSTQRETTRQVKK